MTSSLHGIRLIAAGLLLIPAATSAQQIVQLPAADKILREKPAPIYSIGAEDGEDWELLSGVNQVAFDARDNLYVLDRNNFRVLVFDASGKFLRKIGKKGGGPGEFIAPFSMTITAAGEVVVGDIGRGGYSIFKSDGTFVRNSMPNEGGVGAVGMGAIEAHPRGLVTSGGGLMMLGGALGRGGAQPGSAGEAVRRAAAGERKAQISLFDLTAAKLTSLYEAPMPSIEVKVDEGPAGSGGRATRVMARQPQFMPQVSFGVLPTGSVAVAHETDYRVRVVNPSGKVERILERPIKPKKVTKKDQEIALERMRENMRRGDGGVRIEMGGRGGTSVSTVGGGRGPDAPNIEEMLRSTTFMDYIPVFRRIVTDPQGRIWVQRTPEDQGIKGPVDVVTADGRYIGTIPNDRAPDAVSKSGRAAYIERDDLNIERVVVRRLPATWM